MPLRGCGTQGATNTCPAVSLTKKDTNLPPEGKAYRRHMLPAASHLGKEAFKRINVPK
jgi:hypothetical protein